MGGRAEAHLPTGLKGLPSRQPAEDKEVPSSEFTLKAWHARDLSANQRQSPEPMRDHSSMGASAFHNAEHVQPSKLDLVECPCKLEADDGDSEREYLLDSPGKAAIPKVNWSPRHIGYACLTQYYVENMV
jgi:hypothetical protein